MSPLNDTHPEAEQVLRETNCKMFFPTRLQQIGSPYHTAKLLHAAGIRFSDPEATEKMIDEDWRLVALGPELVGKIKDERGESGV